MTAHATTMYAAITYPVPAFARKYVNASGASAPPITPANV